VHAIPDHNDAVESEAGLRAIPSDELINGVLVNTARSWRAETVEHCQFAMIQIRQAKHSATVIRLDSLFAHSDRLPMSQLWDDRDRLSDAINGGIDRFRALWPDFDSYYRFASDSGHMAKSRVLSLRRFPFTVGL
jgi:hypothetical protein